MTESTNDPDLRLIYEARRSAFVEHLEAELGLPPQWSTFIVAEDNWSFIVKCHALLEAAANRTLSHSIGKAELSEFVSQLEMSGQATGKVTALVKLGILDSDSKRFLSKLSELRNAFVHDVRNTTGTISTFLASLSEADRKGFEKAFCWNIRDWKTRDIRTIAGGNEEEVFFYVSAASSWDQGVPVLSVWFGVLCVLSKLHLAHASEEKKEQERLLLLEASQAIGKAPRE